MAKIVLITGGGRSGKSSYAQRLAESMPAPRVYLATAVAFDQELEDRISRHREARGTESWSTVEEPIDLAGAIGRAADPATVLVDCLTTWVGNLMWERQGSAEGPEASAAPTESEVAEACEQIAAACRGREGTVIFVTNEVGLGIIPENPTARLYRDLLGRCNQVMAAVAGTVILMVSGLPITLRSADVLDLPEPFAAKPSEP